MAYRFAQEHEDFSDFAAGKVFHGLPGHPAFPVRLANEIFQRCLAIRSADGLTEPVSVYDPCCGGAYLLSTLAYFHGQNIRRVVASDIDADVLPTAEANLSLLTVEGLEKRIAQITQLLTLYGKPSHQEALNAAEWLLSRLAERPNMPTTRCFQADALNTAELIANLSGEQIDVVITDVPYGNHSTWHAEPQSHDTVWQMLQALLPVLEAHSLVAICSDKQQKAAHESYRRVEHFQIGKRRIVILRPANF